METKDETIKMRKRNMRLFPMYKMFAWDYLFFYAIYLLFLTQIKGLSASNVILVTTFNALFGIILQIPANIIIEFFGKKNSLILANALNCIYIIILLLSRSIYHVIFAEMFSAIANSLKSVLETTILSESIPPSKYKNKIFSNINSTGSSRFYILETISKIAAGLSFQINGYLPMIFCLISLVITLLISMAFIDPDSVKEKKQKTDIDSQQIKDLKKGLKFVLKSERLKALILACTLIRALLSILSNYNVSLLEEVGTSAVMIGFISAMMSLICAIASRNEIEFHNKFKNRSLITIAMIIASGAILSGIFGIFAKPNNPLFIILVITFFGYGFGNGTFSTVKDKYLGNFANKKINTKIYAVTQLFMNIAKVIAGLFASFLLGITTTAYSMIIIGITFGMVYFFMEKYMKTRVGLKPEQYSEEERKYDELKL